MAEQNISPVYCQWIISHIKSYEFYGDRANALKVNMLSIDLKSPDASRLLSDCYREFLMLFDNSMHRVGIMGSPIDGISTTDIKCFMVKNEYNIYTPIGFMTDFGKKGEYDLAASANLMRDELKSVVNGQSLELFVNEIQSQYRSKHGNTVIGIVSLLCSFIAILFVVIYSGTILSSFMKLNYKPLLAGLIVIALSILFIILSIMEIMTGLRWNELNSVNKSIAKDSLGTGSNYNQNAEKAILDYTMLLDEALKNKQEKLPSGSAQKAYSRLRTDKSGIVYSLTKKPGKLKRKVNIFVLILIFIVMFSSIFVVPGVADERPAFIAAIIGEEKQDEPEPDDKKKHNSPEMADGEVKPYDYKFIPKDSMKIDSADSYVDDEGNESSDAYKPSKAYDDDSKTFWRSKNDIQKPAIKYRFDKNKLGACVLGKIEIRNGNAANEESFYKYPRAKKLSVHFYYDGEEIREPQTFKLDVDYMDGDYEELIIDGPYVECDRIELVVESVEHGNDIRFQNSSAVVISDIKLYEGIMD